MTIQQRGYVVKEDKPGQPRPYIQLSLSNGQLTEQTLTEVVGSEKSKLIPTDIGIVVNDFLLEAFPDIMDYHFTATVERQLDQIAEGDMSWNQVIAAFYEAFHPSVEKASSRTKQKVGERILGTDPKTGRVVSVRIGRFGPIVQIGQADDEEKPLFASLMKGQHMETITLEEALRLFQLPRVVGTYENAPVTVGIGRFGPYIKHDNQYVSIPAGHEPLDISLETCIELIEHKREAARNKVIKTFQDGAIQVLNGRYGPYLSKDGRNYRIPKTVNAEQLTLDDSLKIIEEHDQNTESGKRSRSKKTPASTSKSRSASVKRKSSSKTK
jgi:DNA topoisomerase-1